MMTLLRGKGAMSSTISTYREEFGDPPELEDEGKFSFRYVLQNKLSLVGHHVLVGFWVLREAKGLLDLVDGLVAKNTDDEHVRWNHIAKEDFPEPEVSPASQDDGNDWLDDGKDGLPEGEHREDDHQDQLLEQRDSL